MSITAFKPTGIGLVDAINVFRITFSAALSSIPIITAYDNYQCNSYSGRVFVGSAYYPDPYIAAVGGIAPGTAAWWPGAYAGVRAAGTANRLKGRIYAVAISSSVPGAGGYGYFNFAHRFPYDHTMGDSLAYVVVCEYQYTGSAPTITWQANNAGTEATPIWSTIDSLASGVAPTPGNVTQLYTVDVGAASTGTLGRPSSGVYYGDIWLKNY